MYSDLFDQLSGGAGGSRGGHHHHHHRDVDRTPPPLVSFKAGKMELLPKTNTTGSNKLSYYCQANTARGEVRLVWKNNQLHWQWYDRRDKKVVDSDAIVEAGSTFERVLLTDKPHQDDRIYVWTKQATTTAPPNTTGTSAVASTSSTSSNNDSSMDPAASENIQQQYVMYWMQDANPEKDDEIVAQVNQYLADPQSAAPPASTDSTASGGDRNGAAGSTSSIHNATVAAGSSSSSSNNNSNAQVDALSSILENLGMPQTSTATSSSSSSTPETSRNILGTAGTGAATNTGGTLTLADLQGAMASVQQQQAPSRAGPSLAEVVTPAAVTTLLEQPEVCQRLLECLPPEQRSMEHLEDNLRSPQVQATLRTLTAALMPDDDDEDAGSRSGGAGSMDSFYSVLANFSLDPADGQAALLAENNPILAFLDCILKSVENEKANEQGRGGEKKHDQDVYDQKNNDNDHQEE